MIFAKCTSLRRIAAMEHYLKKMKLCLSSKNPALGNETVYFDIKNPVAMVDEKPQIVVRNLPPKHDVTVFAVLIEEPARFVSHAHFTTDQSGELNLTKMPSIGGSYKGVDGAGLLWSMVPATDCKPGAKMWKKDVTQPYHVQLGVFNKFRKVGTSSVLKDPELLCHGSLQRWYLNTSSVARIPVRTGRVRGTLFVPSDGKRYPGIIDIFGTSGGCMEYRAALLASHGFATLALAYVQYEDLPKSFFELELDYFDEAVAWLWSHDRVDTSRGLGVVGMSKGGEMALHAAAHNNDKINTIVVINSTYFYEFGKHTYRGKPIKMHQYEMEKVRITDEGFAAAACMDDHGDADILPLDEVRGHLLLLQSMDDQAVGSRHADVMAWLISNNPHCDYVMHKYPGAGHLLSPPYTPLNRSTYHKLIGETQFHGGKVIKHAQAQEHSWRTILAFLKRHLLPESAKL